MRSQRAGRGPQKRCDYLGVADISRHFTAWRHSGGLPSHDETVGSIRSQVRCPLVQSALGGNVDRVLKRGRGPADTEAQELHIGAGAGASSCLRSREPGFPGRRRSRPARPRRQLGYGGAAPGKMADCGRPGRSDPGMVLRRSTFAPGHGSGPFEGPQIEASAAAGCRTPCGRPASVRRR